MPFWSTQTVKARLGGRGNPDILTPFDPKLVRQGAVQMRIGEQAVKSSDGASEIVKLDPGVVFTIPPGQFALLLTEEIVHLPDDVLAFISVKTRFKAKGLVNVSGFHVDPGFHGRLKFWVYNAGNQEIVFQRYDPAFHIWFSEFDQPVSDSYCNSSDQMVITSEDVSKMQHGKVPTPAALRTDFEALRIEIRKDYETLKSRVSWVIGVLTAVALFFLTKYVAGEKPLASAAVPDRVTVVLEGNTAPTSGQAQSNSVGRDTTKTAAPIYFQVPAPQQVGRETPPSAPLSPSGPSPR